MAHSELLDEMERLKKGEVNAEDGHLFAYVYTADGDNFELQRKAFDLFTGWSLTIRRQYLPVVLTSRLSFGALCLV